MKETFLTVLLVTFVNLYSQVTKSFESEKGFLLTYEVQNLNDEKSKVILTIENINDEIKYISADDSKFNFDIRSEKLATYDLSYIMVTDPLLNPKMLFKFLMLKNGDSYKTERGSSH